jgi:hypothetical protein
MFSFLSNSQNVEENFPKSTLGYGANSVYPGFPPIMMDGRALVASYQPEAVLNDALKNELNIKSNWEYRNYLTKNAKDIMSYNYRESSNDVGYFKRYQDSPKEYNVPYMYPSFISSETPNGYQTSDLKQTYLSREQLNARKVAPVIKKEDL